MLSILVFLIVTVTGSWSLFSRANVLGFENGLGRCGVEQDYRSLPLAVVVDPELSLRRSGPRLRMQPQPQARPVRSVRGACSCPWWLGPRQLNPFSGAVLSSVFSSPTRLTPGGTLSRPRTQ